MAERSSFTELRLEANGLGHRVLEWTPRAGLADDAPTRTVVLVHGFMDVAASWENVAPSLAARGYRVLAPDMRGFGETDRAPQGSYYHFADYVADLAAITSVLEPTAPLAVVGHSMGGTITTLFTGTFPERVARLVSIEGLGPPDSTWEIAPLRMRRWIEQVDRTRERVDPILTRDDAFARLVSSHPNVPREILDERFVHLVREASDENGRTGVRWRFDPLHRTTSPTPFFARTFIEFIRRVTCPTLFVSGGPSGFHVSDESERLSAFAAVRSVEIDGAGHMIHWTRPSELAAVLGDFLT